MVSVKSLSWPLISALSPCDGEHRRHEQGRDQRHDRDAEAGDEVGPADPRLAPTPASPAAARAPPAPRTRSAGWPRRARGSGRPDPAGWGRRGRAAGRCRRRAAGRRPRTTARRERAARTARPRPGRRRARDAEQVAPPAGTAREQDLVVGQARGALVRRRGSRAASWSVAGSGERRGEPGEAALAPQQLQRLEQRRRDLAAGHRDADRAEGVARLEPEARRRARRAAPPRWRGGPLGQGGQGVVRRPGRPRGRRRRSRRPARRASSTKRKPSMSTVSVSLLMRSATSGIAASSSACWSAVGGSATSPAAARYGHRPRGRSRRPRAAACGRR